MPPIANSAAATNRAVIGSTTAKPNKDKNQVGAINKGIAKR